MIFYKKSIFAVFNVETVCFFVGSLNFESREVL